MKKPTRRQRKAEKAKRVWLRFVSPDGREFRRVWFPPQMWNLMEREANQRRVGVQEYVLGLLRANFLPEGKAVPS